MSKINFFKITMFNVLLFVIVFVVYSIFSANVYSNYNTTDEIVNYLLNHHKTFLLIEPYLKQFLLTLIITSFSLGVVQNILKLTNVCEIFKKIYYYSALVLVSILILLSVITIFYANLVIYNITTILMFILNLIWIITIMIDFIKTKNNYQSIFIRISLAILGAMLIISVGSKVTNDYKVNVSLYNSYEYKINQLENTLPYLDEDSKITINKQIETYQMMQIPLYSNALYSGKSTFYMFNTLHIDTFSSDRLTQKQDAINQIESLIVNYDNSNINFQTYDINSGLYVGGDSAKVLMVIILLVGIVCSIKYPLLRDENIDTDSQVEEHLTVHLIKKLITKEEFEQLIKKVE